MRVTKERRVGRPRIVDFELGVGVTAAQLAFLERESATRAVSMASIVREALTEKMQRAKRRNSK